MSTLNSNSIGPIRTLTLFLSVTPDNKYPEHETLIQILNLNPRPKSKQGSLNKLWSTLFGWFHLECWGVINEEEEETITPS